MTDILKWSEKTQKDDFQHEKLTLKARLSTFWQPLWKTWKVTPKYIFLDLIFEQKSTSLWSQLHHLGHARSARVDFFEISILRHDSFRVCP